MPTTLIDTTFSGKNISSAVSVYEYTIASDCTLRIQLRLAAVAGGGDYIVYLTLNDGDVQTDDILEPKTTVTLAVGETSCWFPTISLDAKAGDVVNVFVDGLAGDTDESGSIRIFSDNYAVAGDEMDLVDAPNGTAVTAIQNGLAIPGDEMDLVDAPNGTAITAIQSGLSTLTADEVWDETLTGHTGVNSAGKVLSDMIAGIWAYGSRTLTSFAGTAADVWAYATRTLTQFLKAPNADSITLYTSSTNTITIANITDTDEIWFTIKSSRFDDDDESILQISKTGGLLYINGAVPTTVGLTSASASLSVAAGNLVVIISSAASAILVPTASLVGDVKTKTTIGAVASVVYIFDAGISQVVTHSI